MCSTSAEGPGDALRNVPGAFCNFFSEEKVESFTRRLVADSTVKICYS